MKLAPLAPLLAVALVVACSSSDGTAAKETAKGDGAGDGGPGTTTTPELDGGPVATGALETQLATAICGFLQRCTAPSVASDYGDANGCITTKSAQLSRQLHAPSTANLAAQVSDCIGTITGRACDGAYLTFDAKCSFTGSLANGAPCSYDTQCASGACFGTPETSCGTCAPVVAIGEDCTNATCGPKGFCLEGTHKCVPQLGPGEDCSQDANACVFGTWCDGAKCVRFPTAGEDCAGAQTCAEGSTCADDTKRCVADKRAKVGESCGVEADTNVRIDCDLGYCTDALTGKCVAWPAEGGACDEEADPPVVCGTDFSCIANKCVGTANTRPSSCK